MAKAKSIPSASLACRKALLLECLRLDRDYTVWQAYCCLQHYKKTIGVSTQNLRPAMEALAQNGDLMLVKGSRPKAWRRARKCQDVLYIQHNCPESAR